MGLSFEERFGNVHVAAHAASTRPIGSAPELAPEASSGGREWVEMTLRGSIERQHVIGADLRALGEQVGEKYRPRQV